MSHKYFTINERNKLEVLLQENYKIDEIVEILGFDRSSIYREKSRVEGAYCAIKAQKNYDEKSRKKGRKSKITYEIKEIIAEGMKKDWSPEQISNTELKGVVSFKTIYNWIDKGIVEVVTSDLRKNVKKKNKDEKRGKFNVGKSIHERPEEAELRKEIGHWELDSVVSSRGKSKECVATFIDRKSRYYVAIKMPNRSSKSMLKAIKKLMNMFPNDLFKTMTSDRGKEFSSYEEIEKMGVDFYFADAYKSGQRGSNEYGNRLLRRYFPKKTDFSTVKSEELEQALELINNYPRKCLNYLTPSEVFYQEIVFN